MIAKVIAHGATRDEALDRLSGGLAKILVAGPKTNVAFLKALCDAKGFRAGQFDTGFIDANLVALCGEARAPDDGLIAAGALYLAQREAEAVAMRAAGSVADIAGPWWTDDGFQLLGHRETGWPISVEGVASTIRIGWDADGPSVPSGRQADENLTLVEAGPEVILLRDGRQTRIALHDPFAVDLEHMDEGGVVKAPMHGKVVAVFVQSGDRVEKGQRLAVVEAMKMEHALVAPATGEIAEVAAAPGEQVAEGARLIVIKTDG